MDMTTELNRILAGMARAESEKKSDVVKTPMGGYVWVDTCYTLDHGYESMVFKCDKEGNVEDWGNLDMELYDSWGDALIGHDLICAKWGEKVEAK